MHTAQWSLLIAALALASSITLPLLFRRQDARERRESKRTLLLQKLLSVKSLYSNATIQTHLLLHQTASQMSETERNALQEKLDTFKELEDAAWQLHEVWNHPGDQKTSLELDDAINDATATESVALDIVSWIETRMTMLK